MKYSRAKLDDINVDSSLEVEIVYAIVYSSKSFTFLGYTSRIIVEIVYAIVYSSKQVKGEMIS